MDKFEYKVRADEIKELIAQEEYAQAAEIADTIDWRRVKSVMMLCTISDLYKINRRYEDARDMLLLAYDRRPGGRTICYSLCELSIKMEEYVQAVEYYKEFVQIAPKDSGRYILQYRLYEAQDVSLEERIEVLEELKKRDYREKWAYELAYLYHRIGLATRCVEECDEMILWFGEGKYVIKALELKKLHQPLTPAQQEKYDNRFRTYEEPKIIEPEAPVVAEAPVESEVVSEDTKVYEAVQPEPAKQSADQDDELDIHVKTIDVGEYNTINLQAELAAGLREVLGEESIHDPITRSIVAPMLESDTESLDYPQIDEVSEDDLEQTVEEIENSEVFFGETGEISDVNLTEQVVTEDILPEEADAQAELPEEQPMDEATVQVVMHGDVTEFALAQDMDEPMEEETVPQQTVTDETAEIVMEQMRQETLWNMEPPKELANVLSQESDGQISLVMPEKESIEKQITGQMSIEDILAEWERMKKENEEKRKEEVRRHVLQQTGTMFTEFEASVRDGLLEQIESGKMDVSELDNAVSEVTGDEDVIEDMNEDITEEDSADEDIIEENIIDEDITEQDGGEETDLPDETMDEVEELEEVMEADEVVEEEAVEVPEEFVIEESPEEVLEEISEEELPEEITEEIIEEIPTEAAEEPMEEIPAEITEEVIEESGEETSVDETEDIVWDVEEESEFEPEMESESVEELEEEPTVEKPEVERDKAKVRALTREERELYAPFVQSRSAREQLVQAVDNISLAAYTGNIIITGEEGMDTLTLAKNMIREVQMEDSNFSGKVAKISGSALNKKEVAVIVRDLKNGALIVQKATEMDSRTADALHRVLQQENVGIIVVLVDTKKAMNHFLAEKKELHSCFTARMDVEALSNDTLVAFGRQYARENEYFIDDMGVLALHTRIDELQTSDHIVTVVEVKEIVDEAIRHANRKTLGHFFDVLLAKRYDDEDMIILSEKDFV